LLVQLSKSNFRDIHIFVPIKINIKGYITRLYYKSGFYLRYTLFNPVVLFRKIIENYYFGFRILKLKKMLLEGLE